MVIPFAALLLALAASKAATVGAVTPTFDPNCEAKWKNISAGHTMCIVGDEGTEMAVDSSLVLAIHNQIRGNVTPPATDMRKVYWDEEAASVAAKWARQCNKYGYHDANDARKLPSYKYMSVGQNMAMNTNPSWQEAIGLWHAEVNNYTFGVGANPPGSVIGHYTQLVSKDVYKIGCGMASCPWGDRTKYYYICNYITGIHVPDFPYTNGTRCKSCEGKCDNGVCECGDTACLYQSTPAADCGCTCQPNMSGADCSTVACNSDWFCPQITTGVCNSKWSGTTNFIRYMCPEKCGLC